MSRMIAIISVALAISTAARGADERKVSGTILRVDAKGRTLSIAPDAGGQAAAVDLEVSRKARITIEGGESGIDSLRVGQKATATYDAGLGVATAVEATGEGEAAPTIHAVAELNTPGKENGLWLSPDGLTLYGVTLDPKATEAEVWSATRKDHGAIFGAKLALGRGRHVTVSGDGLTMYLVLRRADGKPGDSIHVATRRSIDDPFGRPQEVAELRSVEAPRNLALSADGLALYFNHRPGPDVGLSMIVRPSTKARWGTPRPVPVSWPNGVEKNLLCPFVTADGLTLYGVVGERAGEAGNRFTAWSRKAIDRPFSDPVTLGLPEVQEFTGWYPRPVETSHELFFCSQRLSPSGDMDIWLVRNFRPHPDDSPSGGGDPPAGEIRRLEGHTGIVLGAAFSPDGKRLATAGDTMVRLWDTADPTGQAHVVLGTGEPQPKGFVAVAFSPDGKTLAASRLDGGVALWSLAASRPKLLRVLRGHGDPVIALAFSPNGKSLVSGGRNEGKVCFWDMRQPDNAPATAIPAEKNGVWSLAFSPDGKTLAEGVGFPASAGPPVPGEIWMWDVTRRPYVKRAVLKEARKIPRSLAFSPDGSRLAFGDGDVARVVDTRTGRPLGSFEGHSSFVVSVAFTPDGLRAISGGYDKAVRLWDARTMEQVHVFDGHEGYVEQVAVSPDGRMAASVGHDKAVRLWRLPPPSMGHPADLGKTR